jgi:two-component system chemotaxis response regulator CheB
VYTCPECGGTLWQVEHNGLAQFNCYVRHAYAPEALLGQMSARQPAGRLRAAGQEDRPARVEEQAHLDDRHGQLIRSVLLELTPNPETQPLVQQAPEEDRREGQLPASADGG